MCVSCRAVRAVFLFSGNAAQTICVLNPSVGDVLVSKDKVLTLFVSYPFSHDPRQKRLPWAKNDCSTPLRPATDLIT